MSRYRLGAIDRRFVSLPSVWVEIIRVSDGYSFSYLWTPDRGFPPAARAKVEQLTENERARLMAGLIEAMN